MSEQIENSPYFIEQARTWDVTAKYMDLSLTNYKLDHPQVQKMVKESSPKRLITIDNCVLRPGHGEGTLHLDNMTYLVTYAWRGLTEADIRLGEEDFHTVVNWLVRIAPEKEDETSRERMKEYLQEIYLDEGGKLEYELSKEEWLRGIGCEPPTIDGYRKLLENESFSQETIEKTLAEFEKKDIITYPPWPEPKAIRLWENLTS